VYDKQVRRRRATLFGFIALSLLLLTMYFGENTGGGLHSVQRGALSVLGPIQEGANRALKPFRDLFGWVGDTIDAKQERDDLQQANQDLEKQITELQDQSAENAQLKSILEINTTTGLEQYAPIQARVTGSSPNLFYSRIVIDKGSSAGVHNGQAVVGPEGLVGRVTTVTPGYSQVTLITDESFGTGVKLLPAGVKATAKASVNRPGEIELTLLNPTAVRRLDRVVTEGSTSLTKPSFYPPGILIGKVSKIEPGDGNLDTRIRVKPSADLLNLTRVEVLTKSAESQTVAAVDTP
jgi:rod shape-determining protein MreC